MDAREQLEQAIAAQERLRGVVPDDVLEVGLTALRAQLEALQTARPKQRRHVTVLFADLAGFTAMGEAIDAEELSDALDHVWRRLDAVILAEGGQIDKHIGDAVMALWGVEEAREDDPERAIRAALHLQQAVADLSGLTGAIDLRIGINTGPVVLGELAGTEEFTALGDTVNVAARLEAAAPVGGILIGHDTYRHVRGVFSVLAQEPLQVKGKREPLRTYLVHGVQPRTFRLRTQGVEGVETRMVGRDAELARLRDALETARREQAVQVVAVVGDAGIGKSRLLYEFEDWLRIQPAMVRLFRARASGLQDDIPYALARDLFLSRFEIAENDNDEVARQKLRAGIAVVTGDDEDLASDLEPLLGLDAPSGDHVDTVAEARQRRDRALRATERLFSSAASLMPIVVLLEDVHWADRGSLDLFARVAEACTDRPALLVATTRPTAPRSVVWAAAATERIELTTLSDADTGELVSEVLQRVTDLTDVVRERVLDRAAGNPFYVEELVKMMIDDGVIVVDDDEWRVVPERLSKRFVPPTITGVLQARLDRLSPVERDVLQRASVVGQVFWDAAVPDGPDDLRAVLAALEAKELVVRQDTTAFAGCHEYLFKHAILHEVTYDSVLRRKRREHHRQVADWLVARTDGAPHAAAIAGHYEAADLPRPAADWHAVAARHARARYAVDEAIDAYRRAVERDVLDAPLQLALLDELHEALLLRARYDEALEVGQAMLAAAERAGLVGRQALALVMLCETLVRQGRSREGLAHAERAQALLRERGGDVDERMTVLTEMGWTLLRLGRTTEARACAEEALGLAGATDSLREQRGAHSLLGVTSMALGRHELAHHHLHEALLLDRRRGDRRGEAACLINLGEIARLQDDHTRAAELYTEALAIVREVGDRDQEALTLSNLGGARVGAGDHAAAVVHLRDALEAFRESGGSEHLSETHRFLAEAHLGLNDIDAAHGEAREALRLAHLDENAEHLGHAWRVVGLVAARLGRPVVVDDPPTTVDAAQALTTSAAVFAQASLRAERARVLCDLALVEHGRGNASEADALWRQARATFTALGLSALTEGVDVQQAPRRP